MRSMAGFEHLVKSYDVGDLLDEIASADPPAYLRRCFAEGSSAPVLSWAACSSSPSARWFSTPSSMTETMSFSNTS